MSKKNKTPSKQYPYIQTITKIISLVVLSITLIIFIKNIFPVAIIWSSHDHDETNKNLLAALIPPLNKADYDTRMLALANNLIKSVATSTATTTSTSSTSTATSSISLPHHPWPVSSVYPKTGALLPFNRIIAYYGNLYSKQMGVLGQYPTDEMLARLQTEVTAWQQADPSTPVIPALDYIAITAQGSAGDDGMYRARMPWSEIDKIITMADSIHGIVFLDIQVGLSDMKTEIPLLEKYLKMPQVHLALDPEFYMKSGDRPGSVIGTIDASDINYAANYLAQLVQTNNLPPKILVVHRFTLPMITHYKAIETLPEVQLVIDMDGWGSPQKKIGTYNATVAAQPVQFTGFKLFYKNDLLPPSPRIMTPTELLKLTPRPIYIQYQ